MGRATVDQVRQLAVETTAGTTVAANRRLPALSINLSPELEKEEFTAAGYKSTTVSVVNGATARGGYDGPTDFNHIIYPLEGLVGSTGPTGATAYTRIYTPNATGSDTNAKTYSVEAGDAAAARIYNRLRFRSFQLEAGRKTGSRISGSLYANFPTDGQTLAASPTTITQVPVAGSMWNVYLDSSFGGIGTTKIATAYRIGFAVGDSFNPFWALNSANGNSIADEAQIAHSINGRFVMMHDAQSRAFFAGLLANAVVYLRFEAVGALITGSSYYTIRFDMAVQLSTISDDDNDGVFGAEYGFSNIYDASLGSHWKATIINTVATL